MRTECISKQLSFDRFRRRQVGGGDDYRDSGRTEHDLAALALASGCADVVGAGRVRERDRGRARAGSSTQLIGWSWVGRERRARIATKGLSPIPGRRPASDGAVPRGGA